LDPPRWRFGLLGNSKLKSTIAAPGGNAIRIDGLGKDAAAVTASMNTLAALAYCLVVLCAAPQDRALAGQGHIIIQRDLHRLGVDARQVNASKRSEYSLVVPDKAGF
jgi:hypothetical protein